MSEKAHLIELVLTAEDEKIEIDPAPSQELQRRLKVRALRKAKQALADSERKFIRTAKVQGELKASKDTLFLWKKNKYAEGLRISDDGCTVMCPESYSGRYMILGSKGFSQGIYYWEVQVKGANWGSVFIGVAPEDGSSWNGFGFINYRATQAFSNETLYGSYYGVNDKIGVLLDMEKRYT